MILRAIERNLSVAAIPVICLHRRDHEWEKLASLLEEDGATILKIMSSVPKPSLKAVLKD